MEFKTGDVVVDCYNTRGIVIGEDACRPEEVLLLVKTGKQCYSTLQSRKGHWRKVCHFEGFEDILNIL